MPDIAMCANRQCPNKLDCYRYRAKPGARQSYCAFSPDDSGACGGQMKILEGDVLAPVTDEGDPCFGVGDPDPCSKCSEPGCPARWPIKSGPRP